MNRTPKPRQPLLVWATDEDQVCADAMALERGPAQVEIVDIVAPSRIVTGCGKCGGVRGTDPATMSRYPRHCTCKRKRA
jgi:hypothetical protein